VETAAGGRVALNLAGVGVADLRRGDVIAGHATVVASDRLLVALRPPARLDGTARPLPPDRARLRLHVGTDQVDVRVGRAGREAVELDAGRATAILRLDRPIAVQAGDRFVLRRPSPGATAAGGVVLDTAPPRGVSRRRATLERIGALDRAVAGGVRVATAEARLELHGAVTDGAKVELAPDVRSALRDVILATVGGAPTTVSLADVRTVAARELRRVVSLAPETALRSAAVAAEDLVAEGALVRAGDRIAIPGRSPSGPPPEEIGAMDRLVRILDCPAPPHLGEAARAAGCARHAVVALEQAGRIVVVSHDLAWSTPAWHRLATMALEHARRGALAPAALRDATGTSRKYVMALLEDLNRRGILVRGEGGHRPGPRAGTLPGADSVA
jgi:selenocysteine-specific elongation factor